MDAFRVIVSGKVQGVGFRHFAFLEAGRLGIKGFARNIPEGRVEILAIGKMEELEKFLEEIKKGPLRATIENIEFERVKPEKIHSRFDIIY